MKIESQTPNLAIGKKIKLALLFLAGLGFLLIPFNLSYASRLDDLKQQQSEINQDIKDNSQKVKEKKQEIKQISGEISQLDSDIVEIEARIRETQEKINQTTDEIQNKEEQIRQKEEELAIEKENQNEAIRVMYEGGRKNTLELLIGSTTLSEAINHSHYLETLENRIEATIEEINRLKAELEVQKEELETKKKELDKLQEQQQAYLYGLDQQKSQKNILLANSKNQKKSLEEQLEEAKKLNSKVQAEINSIVASMNQGSGRTVLARDRGTSAVGFMWPADYKYISAYYGESTPFQSFHTGIDLANIPGTPIYAASGGTVVAVQEMVIDGHYYGYGKYIVIGHNARFSSLYAHLMGFAVNVGDEVKTGDVIGYMGNTGWSTGPHLHFEVWEYGNRSNPLNYLP